MARRGRGRVLEQFSADKSFREALGSRWVGGREGETQTPQAPPEAPINIYTLGRNGWDTNPRRTDTAVCVSGVGSGGSWSQFGADAVSIRPCPHHRSPPLSLDRVPDTQIPSILTPTSTQAPQNRLPRLREEE